MKIFYSVAIFALLASRTVLSKPSATTENLENVYGALADEGDVQGDTEYPTDYEDDKDEDENSQSYNEDLTILTKGQEFVKKPNETVFLPCQVTGNADPVIIWRKNDLILFQDKVTMGGATPNMKRIDNGTLEISNLDESNAGVYECSIAVRNTFPIKHTLRVMYPAKIEKLSVKDNISTLKSGDTLVLTCTASGDPKPTISWHHGDKRLKDLQGETLTIEKVRHHDAGIYRCLADNHIGNPAFSEIKIDVEFKPIVEVEKISVNSETNLDTELKCTVHSAPKASAVWKKDGINVVNSDHIQVSSEGKEHVLLIKGIEEADFGTYTCSAVNYLGEGERHVKLAKTPAAARFLDTKAEIGKDVTLTWEVESRAPVLELQLQYRREKDEEWQEVTPEVTNPEQGVYIGKHILKSLESGSYEARVRSRNSHGWSEFSDVKNFQIVAKHGHHNKHHKKGHNKDAKEKYSSTTQSPIDNEIPAEHQENDKMEKSSSDPPTKEAAIGASETGGASSVTSSALLLSALATFLYSTAQIRRL